jgi:nitroimidazol reductase NimA-like FMN-containing flavoprotein (pyridoxamine 5'-phosphate oxidase superfamily)
MKDARTTSERSRVRRRDRSVTDDAWIARMVSDAPVASIAVVDGAEPYINTNIFCYDPSADVIYFHPARVGRMRSLAGAGARVCLSIFTMGRMLPARSALEFSVEYEGVVVFGSASIVDDPHEARRALELLLAKYAPHLEIGVDYEPPTEEEMERTAVYRIAIEEWSGKRKEAPEDFPGAFTYASKG